MVTKPATEGPPTAARQGDAAKETAHTVLSILVHLLSRAEAAWWRMNDGDSRAFAVANCQKKSTVAPLATSLDGEHHETTPT